MPSDEHQRLIERAARWLIAQGFGVVGTDVVAGQSDEQADVIGFRALSSVMIEVKVSRADFWADRKKPHRQRPGLGLYRFVCCPEGLIAIDELPPGWGLLVVKGRRVTLAHGPMGNLWPGPGAAEESWRRFQHPVNEHAERSVLYSIARRTLGGKPWQGRPSPVKPSL